MTTGVFRYIDPASFQVTNGEIQKPWSKVDGPGQSFKFVEKKRSVEDISGKESTFGTDVSGFAVHHAPAKEKAFTDDTAVREGYYAEIEKLLRNKLPKVKKVVIFDHTIRRREKNSPRQPVQQVHVDQTPRAAEARVRRHLPSDEAEQLLKSRYSLINVWRPIENTATDFPLAVVDWRTTTSKDFVEVDLLYPKRDRNATGDDDRGHEALPSADAVESTDGYEVKGETFGIAPSEKHKFYYVKDMTPDDAMFIKCFDSKGQGLPAGVDGIARCTPHTAFVDPDTPSDAPGRQSIEVRCLVFFDE